MNTDWIHAATRLQTQQQPFALVTVLRVQPPASAKAGDKALVTADGAIHGWIGGGCAQPAVVKTVRQALQDGQPRTIRITPTDETAERNLGDVLEFGMACHSGGTLELFIDPVLPAAHLVVLGDSPVAQALVGLAPRVGFTVSVVADGASAERFPDARSVVSSDDPVHVAAELPSSGFAVVATQGRRDLQGLKAALALQPRSLWFVASARKAGVLKQTLVASGEDQARVAAIRAPAGEPIGAQTAEEIALTVLMAVVAARRSPGHAAASPIRAEAGAAKAAAAEAVSTATASASASSCCGGAARQAAAQALGATPVAEAPAVTPTIAPALTTAAPAATATVPAKKSCCGG